MCPGVRCISMVAQTKDISCCSWACQRIDQQPSRKLEQVPEMPHDSTERQFAFGQRDVTVHLLQRCSAFFIHLCRIRFHQQVRGKWTMMVVIMLYYVIVRQGKIEGPRTIYHYHFLEWPDKKVPTSADAGSVLDFLQKVDSRWQATSSSEPLVVHCRSAGYIV